MEVEVRQGSLEYLRKVVAQQINQTEQMEECWL